MRTCMANSLGWGPDALRTGGPGQELTRFKPAVKPHYEDLHIKEDARTGAWQGQLESVRSCQASISEQYHEQL